MKISLIMAAFNSEVTIGRAIESFLRQDYQDGELIVVDGASRDETCAIVSGFQSSRIRLQSAPDGGIYDALNRGILRAKGEIIGTLHSNDVLAHSGVLSTVATAMSDPTLDAVYADVVFFKPGDLTRVVRRSRSSTFSPQRLSWGCMPAHPALYLRRRLFDRYGVYPIDYSIAGDFHLMCRIFQDPATIYRHIDEVWTNMEAGGASTSGLRSKIKISREILKACRDTGVRTNIMKIMARYPGKLLEIMYGR